LVWGANRNDAMIGMVARDGNVYFRSETLSPQELTPRIRQCLRTGSERRVYLRADARVRYEAVKPVLEAIQSAGVEDISVLTDESKAPPSVNNQR
jgi:biopolymer transport protein ExbD